MSAPDIKKKKPTMVLTFSRYIDNQSNGALFAIVIPIQG